MRVFTVVFVSRWCYKSGPLKAIGQFSHDSFGRKTRVMLVGFDPSFVRQIRRFEVRLFLVNKSDLWLYHVAVPLNFLHGIKSGLLHCCFYFWLIRSFTDPTYTSRIFACGLWHPCLNIRCIFFPFSLVKSPPRDLQIYLQIKVCLCALMRTTV